MRKLRVLIVEEKRLVAAGLKAQLERLGHDFVGSAKDGREAVQSALTIEPDLIIMRIRTPVVDGIGVARTILAHKAIPIVVHTPYVSADLVRQAREAGVMAYLPSPVDRWQLHSTIELALARFEELQAIRREASDLKEAWETRRLVEQAKGVLMKRLKLSEAEAFRRMQRQRRSMGKSLKEMASTILNAEELFFRRLNVPRQLQAIRYVIRQG
ncbi:MAG: hypothetical protein A3G35_06645 [candidate division NC10 bacterium RIFCSPLOWO2_12_FULL_66_18]|nr:MAG: hypothetical protein A3G35_06645 [candidate division NC10 bacterium RIFCSPLOWO2_12_FULL_66_18]